MKILLVADEPSKSLWDFYDESKLKGLDLILSAGDLPPQYLSFLVTFANCPLLYVRGNHDDVYETNPPDGCICIDGKVYVQDGVRIMGLGGSMRYSYGKNQYTEKEMKKRASKLRLAAARRRGIDIFLTHAPAHGLGDQEDLPHKGFDVFKDVMDKYSPQYMIHGHVHMNYGPDIPRVSEYHGTKIINAYEKYILEI